MTTRRYVTESGRPIHAILAQFDSPASVYHAAEKVRDAGYTRWDAHSPFPIHGMEGAMGVKRTRLPLIVGAGAACGAALGYLMQWWMSADYPLVTQGKPIGSFLSGGWESFMPIIFELGVLVTAFTALIGMLACNGLPRWHHPLLTSERFLKSSDDTFFIAVEAADERFDPERTRALLASAGASHVEIVEE